MRLNKILAIAAITSCVFSVSTAQTIVRISAYSLNGGVAHESLGTRDPIQEVLPANTDAIYTLFISVQPDPEWLTGGPNTSSRWSTLGFSFTYDSNIIDLVFKNPNDGSDVFVSTLNVGATFSQYLAPNPPATGVTAGQLLAKNGSNITVAMTVAATANLNGAANQQGYLRDIFANSYDGELIRVRVNTANFTGPIYNTAPGDPNGNIIIQVNPRDDSRNVQVFGSFIIPEPASMIALGSGLVGLLALRRRRAN